MVTCRVACSNSGFRRETRRNPSASPRLELFDELQSDGEERFITIGPTPSGLVLVVWTSREEGREEGGVTRIISARMATGRERALYRRRMENTS